MRLSLLTRHWLCADYVCCKTDFLHEKNDPPGHVELEPAMTVVGCTWLGVMVIVPTFTVRDESYKPIVATIVSSFVIFVTEHVT
jgi:hypothetical protein